MSHQQHNAPHNHHHHHRDNYYHHNQTPRRQIEDLRVKLNRMRETREEGDDAHPHNGPPPDPVNNLWRDPIRDGEENKMPHSTRGKQHHHKNEYWRHQDKPKHYENKLSKEQLSGKREWDEGKPKNIKVEVKMETGDRHYSMDANETFVNKTPSVLKGSRGATRPRKYDGNEGTWMSNRGAAPRGQFRGRGRGGRGFYRGQRGGRGRGRSPMKENVEESEASKNVGAKSEDEAVHDEEYYEEGVEYYELNHSYVDGENAQEIDDAVTKLEADVANIQLNTAISSNKEEKQADSKEQK